MKSLLVLFFIIWFSTTHATTFYAEIKGNPAQTERLLRILPKVEKVINSKKFEDRIRSSRFTYTDHSSVHVLDEILVPAWELYYEFEARKRNCFLWWCSPWVYGWTYPDKKTVWFNSLLFNERSDRSIAGTVCHEQMHKLGYDHPAGHTSQRPFSVPYLVGDICSDLYEREE